MVIDEAAEEEVVHDPPVDDLGLCFPRASIAI